MSPSLQPSHLGTIARNLIASAKEASVLGTTSRGIFLQLSSSWVVFLTSFPDRGPLTVNLPALLSIPGSLHPGDRVEIRQNGELFFPISRVDIPTASAPTWDAPLPMRHSFSHPRRPARYKELRQLLLKRHSQDGLLPLLLEREPTLPAPLPHSLLDSYAQIRTSFMTEKPAEIASALLPFLGLGSGLTPSGDDLVLGFLLALNRWGRFLAPRLDLHAVNQAVFHAAAGKISYLSTSLIACACLGQADERLIFALDGMMSGDPILEEGIQALSTWGSTSGLDALVGMAILID